MDLREMANVAGKRLLSGTAISPAARNRTRLLAIPGRLSQCLRRELCRGLASLFVNLHNSWYFDTRHWMTRKPVPSAETGLGSPWTVAFHSGNQATCTDRRSRDGGWPVCAVARPY